MTVLQAELVEVLNCALWVEEESGEGHQHIGTDSRNAIEDPWSVHNHLEVRVRLLSDPEPTGRKLSTNNFLATGHTEIKGNKIADRLAKQARKEVFTGPEPTTSIYTTR